MTSCKLAMALPTRVVFGLGATKCRWLSSSTSARISMTRGGRISVRGGAARAQHGSSLLVGMLGHCAALAVAEGVGQVQLGIAVVRLDQHDIGGGDTPARSVSCPAPCGSGSSSGKVWLKTAGSPPSTMRGMRALLARQATFHDRDSAGEVASKGTSGFRHNMRSTPSSKATVACMVFLSAPST
jgi:hypothetical protein